MASFKIGLSAGNSDTGTMNRQPPQIHPTVAFLLLLIVAEYVGYCALRYAFRSHHGG